MTFARSSFSLSIWWWRLSAILFLGALAGCYLPVPYYDFSDLSDNVVDASIKKHIRPYPGTTEERFARYRQGMRNDFLAMFSTGSPSQTAVSYLASIGSLCHVESRNEEHQTDRCKYERTWRQYLKHPLSKEFIADKVVIIDYAIASSSGKIEDVLVDVNLKHINK